MIFVVNYIIHSTTCEQAYFGARNSGFSDYACPDWSDAQQSLSPSMPVRRLGVGIALEKSNWVRPVIGWRQIVRWISNVSSTHAWQLLQNINKVFGISRRKFDTFYTEIDWKQLEILGEICTKASDW
jgi:hypothetical protein